MTYLGVDGGGTKTAFALIDEAGNLLAEHQEKTCYHIEVGLDGAREVLRRGVVNTMKNAGKTVEDIDYTFLGLPAYGEDSSLTGVIDSLPSVILPESKYQCDNDMVSGWAAGFGCEDGINIVSGTGSIAYGVRKNKTARCGGWGELFSDEGSAYWIGCNGLRVFSRMSDGRTAKGPLYDVIKSSLEFEQDLDLSALVHTEWNGERGRIAQISQLISEAADIGDKEALAIFARAGQELADIVEGIRSNLEFPAEEVVQVSYSGGAFSAKEVLLEPFTAALQSYSSHYSLHQPKYSPVMGAALYARELSRNSSPETRTNNTGNE